MKRPLEQCGWHKRVSNDTTETYYKGKDWLNSSICINFNATNGSIVSIMNSEEISLEELLALYETAKQIKEEGELEERTFCNKSANKGAIKNEVL